MYIIVWRYNVRADDCAAFESVYGLGGEWSNLFKKSENFIGIRLYKNDTEYLLTDAWESQEAYVNFLAVHKEQYNNLNSKHQHLYEKEFKIGEFYEITGK